MFPIQKHNNRKKMYERQFHMIQAPFLHLDFLYNFSNVSNFSTDCHTFEFQTTFSVVFAISLVSLFTLQYLTCICVKQYKYDIT